MQTKYPGIPIAPSPKEGDKFPISGKCVNEPIIPGALMLGLTTVWVDLNKYMHSMIKKKYLAVKI